MSLLFGWMRDNTRTNLKHAYASDIACTCIIFSSKFGNLTIAIAVRWVSIRLLAYINYMVAPYLIVCMSLMFLNGNIRMIYSNGSRIWSGGPTLKREGCMPSEWSQAVQNVCSNFGARGPGPPGPPWIHYWFMTKLMNKLYLTPYFEQQTKRPCCTDAVLL